MNGTRKAGFTAVELLITLFVAFALLMSGYLLSSIVVNESGEMRAALRATAAARKYANQYQPAVGTSCVAATPLDNQPVTVSGIADVRVTVTVTCPNSAVPNVSRVLSSVHYNDNQSASVVEYSY